MNAIQQFAQKYGKVTGEELDRKYDDIASEFSKSVKSVLDEGGEFFVDDTLNEGTSKDFNVWQAILTGVDEHLIPMNHSLVLVLNTDLKNGSSRLECHYYDDDANLLSKVDGEPGNFNPIPVIVDCIAQYWDKKRSNKKTKPRKKESVMKKCSMQKKKESLAKKNESFTLPGDVATAMKLVKDFLEENQDAIVHEQIVSDEDASVGYQIELALNVLTDLVANAPKS